MRNLLKNEVDFLLCLLREAGLNTPVDFDAIRIVEMKDGGMGSLYIAHQHKEKKDRKMGKSICEKLFADIDNIPISVTLNVDEDGDLHELDIWKVDFSSLKSYPAWQAPALSSIRQE